MAELYHSNGVYVLDQNFNKLVFVDKYTSLIWIERFNECGEFELYMRADSELVQYFQINNFIMRDAVSPYYTPMINNQPVYVAIPEVMIIEKVRVETSEENGNYFIISGRTLDCVMDRRTILLIESNTYSISSIMTMMRNAVTVGHTVADTKPDIEWLSDGVNALWTSDTSLTPFWDGAIYPIAEPIAESCLNIIHSACKKRGCGFRFVYMPAFPDASDRTVYFYPYVGQNKTINQNIFQPVIFSPEYNNLVSSSYEFDAKDWKNVCDAFSVDGDDWFNGLKYSRAFYNNTEPENGLEYRETILNANVLFTDSEGNARTDAAIKADIQQAGVLDLLNKRANDALDFEVISTDQFQYQKEYFLGDTVTVDNGYGISVTAQVIEVSQVWDENGYRIVPKLEVV